MSKLQLQILLMLRMSQRGINQELLVLASSALVLLALMSQRENSSGGTITEHEKARRASAMADTRRERKQPKEDKRFRSRAPGHSGTEFPTDRRMGPDKMCRNKHNRT